MANGTQAAADLFENPRLELQRGCLIVAVVVRLRGGRSGYISGKALANGGPASDEGTLYPLLQRLESQGLADREWRQEDRRNQRFCGWSPAGEVTFDEG